MTLPLFCVLKTTHNKHLHTPKTLPGLSRSTRFIRLFCLLIASIAATSAYAAPPVAVADVRAVGVNSSITLNLIANDFDDDGDTISVISVDTPENGVAELNPDGSIIYTPNADFTGVDSFSYTIQEQSPEQLTSTALVTITVTENVFGQLPGVADAESLAEVFGGFCGSLRELNETELGDVLGEMLARCNALSALAASNPALALEAIAQIAPEETLSQMRSTLDSGRTQTNVVSQRLAQVRSGGAAVTLNGMDLSSAGERGGAAGDEDSIWAPFGIFATFQLDKTERDKTSRESGYDSDGSNFSFGADYRLNQNAVLGLAIGLNNNDLAYSNNGGKMESDLSTYIAFGSWAKNRFVLEGQLGFGDMDFDSVRNIRYFDGINQINEVATGSTSGSQQMLNAQLQWEWSRNALTLFPFARIDSLRSRIKAYDEVGSAGFALMLGKQKVSQITVSSGFQGTYSINRNWGVLVPTMRVAVMSETKSDRDAISGRFAFDPDASNNFGMPGDGGDKSFAQISLGGSAVFKRGMSAFMQYQQVVGYENLSSWQVQAGFRYEL